MSDLVVYCVPRKFSPTMLKDLKTEAKKLPFYYMSSFNETRAKDLMTAPKFLDSQIIQQKDFQVYHQKILSRIYPKVGKSRQITLLLHFDDIF